VCSSDLGGMGRTGTHPLKKTQNPSIQAKKARPKKLGRGRDAVIRQPRPVCVPL
jgi:hypothetical protein